MIQFPTCRRCGVKTALPAVVGSSCPNCATPYGDNDIHTYLDRVAEAERERRARLVAVDVDPIASASEAFANMDRVIAEGLNPRKPTGSFRSILAEAGDFVHGDRRKDYGSPLENHTRTARLWSAYLGVDVTAEDVCMLNALQKISRQKHAPKRDNLVDLAGYAANVELIENERKQKP